MESYLSFIIPLRRAVSTFLPFPRLDCDATTIHSYRGTLRESLDWPLAHRLCTLALLIFDLCIYTAADPKPHLMNPHLMNNSYTLVFTLNLP